MSVLEKGHEDVRDTWASYLASITYRVPDEEFASWQSETFALSLRYTSGRMAPSTAAHPPAPAPAPAPMTVPPSVFSGAFPPAPARSTVFPQYFPMPQQLPQQMPTQLPTTQSFLGLLSDQVSAATVS